MISTAEFKKGLKIEIDGEPYNIVDFQHVKPGKGGAFIRTRLKSLVSGKVIDKTFRAGEKVKKPEIQEKESQYLYKNGEGYHFMDMESYDQIILNDKDINESKNFLKENILINILFHSGKPIGLELPTFIELRVVKTEPGVKGDTVSGGSKPALVETGAVIQVPLFINEGDIIKIDTRSREYIERIRS